MTEPARSPREPWGAPDTPFARRNATPDAPTARTQPSALPGVRRSVYIVTGRVFTTAPRRDRATHERDGLSDGDHTVVSEAAAVVAERPSVPPSDRSRSFD